MTSKMALALSGLFLVSAVVPLLKVRPNGVLEWVAVVLALTAPGLATVAMLQRLRRTQAPSPDELRMWAANVSIAGYVAVSAIARLIP